MHSCYRCRPRPAARLANEREEPPTPLPRSSARHCQSARPCSRRRCPSMSGRAPPPSRSAAPHPPAYRPAALSRPQEKPARGERQRRAPPCLARSATRASHRPATYPAQHVATQRGLGRRHRRALSTARSSARATVRAGARRLFSGCRPRTHPSRAQHAKRTAVVTTTAAPRSASSCAASLCQFGCVQEQRQRVVCPHHNDDVRQRLLLLKPACRLTLVPRDAGAARVSSCSARP